VRSAFLQGPPAWAEFIPYNPEGICAGASNFFWRRKNFKAKRVVDGFRKIKNFSYTLSLAPLENKVLHLPPHQFYPYKIHI